MAIRKNKKRIDPRYFLNETAYRDEIEETQQSVLNEGVSLRDALGQSANTAQGNDGFTKYPVIKISNNQYIQLSQFIQYAGNRPVVNGYHVDFSTRGPSDGSLSGNTGRIGEGKDIKTALTSALEYIQKAAQQGKGPYGTDPIDVDSTEPGATTA